MAQKNDEVRKNNEGGCIRLMRPPSLIVDTLNSCVVLYAIASLMQSTM